MGILLVYDVTDERSFNSACSCVSLSPPPLVRTLNHFPSFHVDIRNWIRNIEQHASEGVNKILIGNKSDMLDKKVGLVLLFSWNRVLTVLDDDYR